ncbi:MAG: hypothetical protein IJ736_16590, partial [Firmicutes bacterium]|nr:hypothetical protein [Bacillota bacterium]
MIYINDNELYINYKEFENYSKSQASAYLKWYLSIKEKRIMYLNDYIIKDTVQEGFLDFSEESLIKLWEWFQSKIFV